MIIVGILVTLILSIYLFMRQEKFGQKPAGERLQCIQQSPNFKNGQFQNISHTPSLTEGATFFSVLKKFLFEKNKRKTPSHILPSKKTNLLHLAPNQDIIVWFGHSSYFMQLDRKTFLVDPVLSGSVLTVEVWHRQKYCAIQAIQLKAEQ